MAILRMEYFYHGVIKGGRGLIETKIYSKNKQVGFIR